MTRFFVASIVLALAGFSLAHARPLAAPELTDDTLRSMGDPVVVDRAPAKASAERLARDLESLGRMVELVGDRKERKVLRRHLDEMRAELGALQAGLDSGYMVKAWLPHKRRPGHPVRNPTLPIRPVAPPPPAMVDPKPMPDDRFAEVLKSVEDTSFSSDKLALIKRIAGKNHFSIEQARQLVEKLSFNSGKRKALVALYPRLVDPGSAHTLLSALSSSSDRRKVQAAWDKMDEATGP